MVIDPHSAALAQLKTRLKRHLVPGPAGHADSALEEALRDVEHQNVETALLFREILALKHVVPLRVSAAQLREPVTKLVADLRYRTLGEYPILVHLTSKVSRVGPTMFLVEERWPRTVRSSFVISVLPPAFPTKMARLVVRPYSASPVQHQTADESELTPPKKLKRADLYGQICWALQKVTYPRTLRISPSELDTSELDAIEGPDLDEHFAKLAQSVFMGTGECRRAIVPASLIVPFDGKLCLRYPADRIIEYRERIEQGQRIELLLYWSGTSYVCSDDYAPYLAYRMLKADRIPAVIMGPVHGSVELLGSPGGAELIPPIHAKVVRRSHSAPGSGTGLGSNIDSRLQTLAERHTNERIFETLAALRIRLLALLQLSSTTEKDLHDFLYQHPEIVDPTATEVVRELRLGGDYRIDLAFVRKVGSVQTALLVELENSSHVLFTRKGQPTAPVVHALQQVEDWFRWWRQNPHAVPLPLRAEYEPEGLVVVGRSVTLSSAEQSTLAHLNTTRRIKVLTYDMLVIRFDQLVRSLKTHNT